MEQQNFDKFLTRFDGDRASAVKKFEFIYADLIGFFRNQRNLEGAPEDYATETVVRVVKRKDDSEEIQNFRQFIFGVAWKVLHESRRRELILSKLMIPLENFLEDKALPIDSDDEEEEHDWRLWKKRRLRCMRQCARNLSAPEYNLLREYAQNKKQARERLAEQLGITIDNLRLRVHHVRERLKECRAGCLKKYSEQEK